MKFSEVNLKDYMILPRESLYNGQTLNFSIYIHMEKNDTFVLYHKIDDVLSAADMEKILQLPDKALRIPKKEYVAFLDSQKTRIKDSIKTGVLEAQAVKATANSLMKSFDQNQTENLETSESVKEMSENASAMLNDMTKTVSDMILQFKKTPSSLAYEQIIHSMDSSKDPLLSHNYKVSGLSVLILMATGSTSMDDMLDIGLAGLLHDIGMSSISKSLLEMHLAGEEIPKSLKIIYIRHIDFALEMLKAKEKEISAGVKRIIEMHHENMDGSGFRGAVAGKIYVPARALRIADELCVGLTSPKNPRSMKEVLHELREARGTTSGSPIYDTAIIDTLIKSFA